MDVAKEKAEAKKAAKAKAAAAEAELSKKKGVKNSTEAGFGDVQSNDPNSEVTREKLRALLKTGAFSFNDGERSALNDILN